jgi:two-component system response regulator
MPAKMSVMRKQALLLVAEDDPDDQYFFQEAIEVACPGAVETHFVFDGAQLISFLQKKEMNQYRKNLVVLDLNMQVKDGRTVLRDIKSDPAFAGIPVVVLTTSDNQDDIEYCLQNGAAAYYQKPSKITDLVRIIRHLCQDFLN